MGWVLSGRHPFVSSSGEALELTINLLPDVLRGKPSSLGPQATKPQTAPRGPGALLLVKFLQVRKQQVELATNSKPTDPNTYSAHKAVTAPSAIRHSE